MLKILVLMQCTLVLLLGLLVPIPHCYSAEAFGFNAVAHGSNTEAFGSTKAFGSRNEAFGSNAEGFESNTESHGSNANACSNALDLKEGAFVSNGSNAATFGEQPAKYACLT